MTIQTGPLPASPTGSVNPRTLAWLRSNLFSSVSSTVVTLVLAYLIARASVALFQWGYWNAVWAVPENQTDACRSTRGVGACWAVIHEKYRFILFGTYPFAEQWRPAAAICVFVAMTAFVPKKVAVS